MKKIINGQRFDTEKAKCVGVYEHSRAGDFNWIFERLYITPRSRKYFVAGAGGPNTKYRKNAGQNNWSGGERIFPMKKEDAFIWAQEYLSAEDVEDHFGDMIEDA